MKETMTREHEYWRSFIFMLALTENNSPCKHGESKEGVLKVLDKLNEWEHGLDVKSTIEYLEYEGGYCDCEVMMNVVKPGDLEFCKCGNIIPPEEFLEDITECLFCQEESD